MNFAWTSLIVGLSAVPLGCWSRRATPNDCQQILDRIVEIELSEMGYADPALATRKQADLHRTLGPELDRCVGRRLPASALACVRRARTAEEIAHGCLR